MNEIDAFLHDQASRGLSPATIKALRSDLKNFVQWWESAQQRPFSLQQLVTRDIRRWQTDRQRVDGVSPRTLNRNLSSLRCWCQWAIERGQLPDNPLESIQDLPQADLAPRFVSDRAVDALLRAPRVLSDHRLRLRDQALLALLVYAGLRSQEACDMQLRDLDLAGRMLTVRQGKGNKTRRVPLHSDAQSWLVDYLNDVRCPDGIPEMGSAQEREPVLVGLRMTSPGQPLKAGIKTRVVRKRIKQLGQLAAQQLQAEAKQLADIELSNQLDQAAQQLLQVSPHQLRHSLARRLLHNGAQLVEVQRILGHSRLSTTGMYLLPSENDLQAAIERSSV